MKAMPKKQEKKRVRKPLTQEQRDRKNARRRERRAMLKAQAQAQAQSKGTKTPKKVCAKNLKEKIQMKKCNIPDNVKIEFVVDSIKSKLFMLAMDFVILHNLAIKANKG